MVHSALKKPRFTIFQGVLLVSMAIHLAILLHLSDRVGLGARTYIELGLKENSRPVGREIPRPRARHTPPTVATAQETRVQKMALPPVRIDPVDTSRPDTPMAGIGVPQLPGAPCPTPFSTADWGLSKPSEFFTKKDYFDMLRLKIETCKRYPDTARARHREGKVTISFVITARGKVLSAAIVTPARHKSLDRAALRALKDAAPFAPPPANLFKPPLAMEITIVFELT